MCADQRQRNVKKKLGEKWEEEKGMLARMRMGDEMRECNTKSNNALYVEKDREWGVGNILIPENPKLQNRREKWKS